MVTTEYLSSCRLQRCVINLKLMVNFVPQKCKNIFFCEDLKINEKVNVNFVEE